MRATEFSGKAKFCDVCDTLRRKPGGESKWQHMMRTKREISEAEFLANVNINELSRLDDGETWEEYRQYSDLTFYESDNEYFIQEAGFEYIWNK